ncbi:MAG: hypothetical protein K2G77_05060, partial [Muribaculaceae bacterium]|nr:hypothetical protein [Muribaculaceae bacterium]
PQIADISSDVYASLGELGEQREIMFCLPGDYPLTVTSSDSLFNVSLTGDKASKGKILLSVSAKDGYDEQSLHRRLQGKEYMFPATIQCSDPRFFIANPKINIHVSDGIPSRLTLAQGHDEIKADGVQWHDAFLWREAAPDSHVAWDLNPVFENQLDNSALRLKFKGENSDFQAWFNGVSIADGDLITISPGEQAILKVAFANDAATGKRYFHLLPETHTGIDMVNGVPIDQYEGTSLRTRYSVVWNPLKTLLLWTGIILAALLILWLIVLKRICFPVIKMGKVELAGPGSYYATKKIKGARKVVFSSRKRSQSMLSRLFTGEVKYFKADHFTPDLEIHPAGGKKRVRVSGSSKGSRGWEIYPTSIFSQYDKGTAENISTGEKMEIEFS